MELRGKVHEIGATQNVTDTFKKRDLIVAYAENPQFVEYIRFEATQDRVNIFDNLSIGEEIEISFNLRGRPWTNKEGVTTYFNSIVAWRVTKLANTAAAAPTPGFADMPAPVDISSAGADDDLPF
ncbi:DUF3127 domain-containing protein [Sphingobacterium rhinopitheci]|uniref:DUF3127 domain-containing protein n=1 Tax=Sphingobacterium rhinopitheci TaxID=2781960 RepID=UPI001F518221|nr:DUF3127 domain-containing protein [Sphingobacterium rhinopitheci]MCI0920360.1 DUF3127 domain-containing protein [Sphingobacterium rhinopitheci]